MIHKIGRLFKIGILLNKWTILSIILIFNYICYFSEKIYSPYPIDFLRNGWQLLNNNHVRDQNVGVNVPPSLLSEWKARKSH